MHATPDAWVVQIHEEFDAELDGLPKDLRIELLSHAGVLSMFGPNLGRPLVDALGGSGYPNMKELRFSWQAGVWRVAFAFDPLRRAILLVGGDKRGADQGRFYRNLIAVADARYANHLATLVKPR
ncbi:MAG: addiction module toxin RelE [Rhodocyclaceae bacterium]|nr:addiction module toxin RelE [Rhodocyclaceae bacterium]